MIRHDCVPIESRLSTHLTAPEFAEPGRTDWAVHVALWERRTTSVIGCAGVSSVGVPGGRVRSRCLHRARFSPLPSHRWSRP
jgi:hypothetical protein